MSKPDHTHHDVQDQRVDSERDLNESGERRDEGDESSEGEVDFQSIESVLLPGPVGTCMLEGCSNSIPIDDLESEYCSKKHQKYVYLSLRVPTLVDMVLYFFVREAIASKQVELCIMCQSMPKGQTDHFCSTKCRTSALCRI